jgi:hypothetical protein
MTMSPGSKVPSKSGFIHNSLQQMICKELDDRLTAGEASFEVVSLHKATNNKYLWSCSDCHLDLWRVNIGPVDTDS